MTEVWEFIKYALRSVWNMFAAGLGRGGDVSDNWLKDGIVGFLTLILLLFILYWIFRFTGLLKVEK